MAYDGRISYTVQRANRLNNALNNSVSASLNAGQPFRYTGMVNDPLNSYVSPNNWKSDPFSAADWHFRQVLGEGMDTVANAMRRRNMQNSGVAQMSYNKMLQDALSAYGANQANMAASLYATDKGVEQEAARLAQQQALMNQQARSSWWSTGLGLLASLYGG